MSAGNSRDHGFDNIRCILIFLVVFGHLLEFCHVPGGTYLYRLIYLFHIPCLLFLSGYFTKEAPSTSRFCLQVLRYILFQGAYLVFARYIWAEEVLPQFATPYWILWFLLASGLYPVFLHAYHLDTSAKRHAAVGISFFVALLAGFDDSVGYTLSLSRLLAFQPFFLLGYCFRKEEGVWLAALERSSRRKYCFLGICVAGLIISGLYIRDPDIHFLVFHRSTPYSEGLRSLAQRATVSLLALAWIGFFVLILRKPLSRKLPLVSRIGANTLPVFLLHGFFLRTLSHYHTAILDHYSTLFLITMLCLLVLGNPVLTRLLNPSRKQTQIM